MNENWVVTLDKADNLHVPTEYRRCLFELWDSFPASMKPEKGHERIRAFGYVIDRFGRNSKIYLPLYEKSLSIFRVARWHYVDDNNCQLRGGI